DLIGESIRFQGDKLNMKVAGAGSPVEWHQDFAFYPHSNDDLLAAGIHLDDSDLENGCMLVIPGSHRGPVLDHHQDDEFVGAVDPRCAAITDATPVPIVARAGSMSIHHCRLLHASAPNRSGRPRRLLLYQYAAADAVPLFGPDRMTWEQSLVRGREPAEVRMSPIEVMLP